MQSLTGSVGENARNARHDAALVQAILTLVKRPATLDPKAGPYLSNIDGDCGNNTQRAIRQFQYDRVFVDAAATRSQPVPGATAGLIAPDDVTWKALVACVPPAFADLRVLQTSKTVYVGATPAQQAANTARVGQLTFAPTFRRPLVSLLEQIYRRYGISVGVCRQGDRRDFQTQYELLNSVDANGRRVTRSGPGESNHNFGQGVDIGFGGLRWLRADGIVIENETSWLHRLDPGQAAAGEALIFWNMLRSEGVAMGLFRGPESDRPHLQAWSDAGIDMADRLADLLTRKGKMRWKGRAQRYRCDLGFRGDYFDVGTAAAIWNHDAPVTVAMLTLAQSSRVPGLGQTPAAAAISRGATGQMPITRPVTGQIATVRTPVVTQADVRAMQTALRNDFEAADANWADWLPR
jgi:peptidoglycan hydrolase-like protein with peptidoglycan-binding domain